MALSADYCLLCEAHAESMGRHSLINVFDGLNCPRFPAQMPRCFLVARLRGDSGEYSGRLRFIAGSDEQDVVPPLPEVKIRVEEGLRPSAFLVFELAGLPLPREGFYSFVLELDGVRVAECELIARLVRPEG
jgi:hypothetical protein